MFSDPEEPINPSLLD